MNLNILLNDLIIYNSSNNNLDEFKDYYTNIIEKDKIQPIFSQTSKYNNNLNAYQKKKFSNFTRKIQKWKSNKATNTTELIKKIVFKYLNIISNKNFNHVLQDFLNEIKNINDPILFDIISINIIDKCINDPKYQEQYIEICNQLWSDNSIIKNFITIHQNPEGFFWSLNNDAKLNGPYKSLQDLKSNVIKIYSFKQILINHLRNEFQNKDNYIEEYEQKIKTDVDAGFKMKRKIIGIVEIIVLLYNKKYIEDNIIHSVLQDLLSDVCEINFELVHYILKNIHSRFNKSNYKKNVYIHKNNKKFNSRTLFFIDSILDLYHTSSSSRKIKNNSNSHGNSNQRSKYLGVSKTSVKYTIENDEATFLKFLSNKNTNELMNILSNTDELEDFIYTLFYSYLEDKSQTKKDYIINTLKKIKKNKKLTTEYFVNILNENKEDLELDFSNIGDEITTIKAQFN